MGDGTVQKRCPGKALGCWSCTTWFDLPSTGRPPTYCSTNCRVAAHRDRKDRAAREAARIAHERHLAQLAEDHHLRWSTFLLDNLPHNSRVTVASIDRLYHAMIEANMIEGPFDQGRLF